MMALESIFYDSFTKISDSRFRIRIDPSTFDDHPPPPPPLFLEVSLPDLYPSLIPQFDVTNINNNLYPDFVKKAILHGLHEQASHLIGESMCYNLVEWLKDKLPELYSMKPILIPDDVEDSACTQSDGKDLKSGKKDAKEKLTKAQKRRYFDKFGATAEKPRGWDWVSIISHLSQVPQHGSSS